MTKLIMLPQEVPFWYNNQEHVVSSMGRSGGGKVSVRNLTTNEHTMLPANLEVKLVSISEEASKDESTSIIPDGELQDWKRWWEKGE